MDSSSVNGMCRCCASEGAFKDIKTSYHWMGEEEVYGDMLRECFDVNLSSAEHGGICEVCITQLRNAANFKKQVLHTESQFKQHLRSKGFKAAQVKEEMSGFDDNDSDDMDNVDDEDYVPDYEVPIKTESESEEKPKKRAAKPATTRSKKSKSNDGEAAVKSDPPVGEDTSSNSSGKKKKETLDKTENREKVLNNIKQILLWSNATPIWQHGPEGYQCAYCEDSFQLPRKLKKHTIEEHDNINEARFLRFKVFDFIFKLDVTSLKCNLCKADLDSLEQLIDHLKIKHKKSIEVDTKDTILPFKFDTDTLTCVMCSTSFGTFVMLLDHMIMHFSKGHVCEVCGKGFIWQSTLETHLKEHGETSFKCRSCLMKFTTSELRDEHAFDCTKEKIVCDYCPESFANNNQKQAHMVNEHGTPARNRACNVCNRTFNDNYQLQIHVRKDHLKEKDHVCTVCDKAFFTKVNLQRHFIKHTGRKDYKCELCEKQFVRSDALQVHMRAHSDVPKPFKCPVCDQGFTQKAGMQGHMRTKHGQII